MSKSGREFSNRHISPPVRLRDDRNSLFSKESKAGKVPSPLQLPNYQGSRSTAKAVMIQVEENEEISSASEKESSKSDVNQSGLTLNKFETEDRQTGDHKESLARISAEEKPLTQLSSEGPHRLKIPDIDVLGSGSPLLLTSSIDADII